MSVLSAVPRTTFSTETAVTPCRPQQPVADQGVSLARSLIYTLAITALGSYGESDVDCVHLREH